VSTWITQRHQDRRDLLAKRIFYHEQLYSDFISESVHALADGIQHNLHDPNKLTPTYALLSRNTFKFFNQGARERRAGYSGHY
jgi:hypothetical protein